MEDASFLCDVCSKTFTKAWGLSLHKKIHQGLQKKECLYCRKKFTNQTDLDDHKAKEHANAEHSEKFRSDALSRVAEVGLEKAAAQLMLHEATLRSWMNSGGQYYCSECHKSFRFQSFLNNHMKIHKEKGGKRIKSFKEKRFTEAFKKEVVDHAKVHSARSAGLVFGLCESTVRSILKAASFPCNLCDRKCAYKRQLERHLLEVHKVEQEIKTEESQKKKVVSHNCNLCKRKCAYRKQLERHVLNVHKVDLSEQDRELKIEATASVEYLQESTKSDETANRKAEYSALTDSILDVGLFEQIHGKDILKQGKAERETLPDQNMLQRKEMSSKLTKSQHGIHGLVADEIQKSTRQEYPNTDEEIKPSNESGHKKKPDVNSSMIAVKYEELCDSVKSENDERIKRLETREEDTMLAIVGVQVDQLAGREQLGEVKSDEDKTERTAKLLKEEKQESPKRKNIKQVFSDDTITTNKLTHKPTPTVVIKHEKLKNAGTAEKVQNIPSLQNGTRIQRISIKDARKIIKRGKDESNEVLIETKETQSRTKKQKNQKRYEKRLVTCDLCGVGTREIRRHMVKHTKLGTFKCDHCEKTFGLSFNLKRHIDTSHNPNFNFFHCSQCPQKYTQKANLDKHEIKHRENIIKKIIKKRPRFSCNLCNKEVAGKYEFRNHMKQHVEGRPACEICQKDFAQICHLNKHKAKKHPELVPKKPVFQCNICHDTSSTDAKLKKHYSAVHNQILRDFLCAVCSKSYGDKRQLEVHNEVAHLKMKRFDCRVCGKKFGRRSSLRAHMKYLHSGGGSNFACDKCPIVYKSKRNLLNHVEIAHAI